MVSKNCEAHRSSTGNKIRLLEDRSFPFSDKELGWKRLIFMYEESGPVVVFATINVQSRKQWHLIFEVLNS